MLHRSTYPYGITWGKRYVEYVDAAYCYRPSSVVCRSVYHSSEPCKNGSTDRDAIWVEDSGGSKEPWIRWRSRSPQVKVQFLRERTYPGMPDDILP